MTMSIKFKQHKAKAIKNLKYLETAKTKDLI